VQRREHRQPEPGRATALPRRVRRRGAGAAGLRAGQLADRITVGGNPNLEPETSITKTLGMVYSPGWAPGLDLYLDWYNIRLSSAVGIRSGQFIVNDCYLNANATSCATIERVAPGDIADLFAGAQNLPGGLETEGYDFTATYKMETEYGKFTFNWDSTYVAYFGELGQPDRLDELSDGTLAGGNTTGTYLVFDPRWRVRSNLTSNWSFGDWGATIGMRYYSGIDEPCVVPDEFLDLCTDPDNITDLGRRRHRRLQSAESSQQPHLRRPPGHLGRPLERPHHRRREQRHRSRPAVRLLCLRQHVRPAIPRPGPLLVRDVHAEVLTRKNKKSDSSVPLPTSRRGRRTAPIFFGTKRAHPLFLLPATRGEGAEGG
jgi:hypothetical protein